MYSLIVLFWALKKHSYWTKSIRNQFVFIKNGDSISIKKERLKYSWNVRVMSARWIQFCILQLFKIKRKEFIFSFYLIIKNIKYEFFTNSKIHFFTPSNLTSRFANVEKLPSLSIHLRIFRTKFCYYAVKIKILLIMNTCELIKMNI